MIDARTWIENFVATVADRSAELTDLDRRAGDGDFGTNLRAALRRASANLGSVTSTAPDAVFTAVSDGFLDTGGTSGPLFGMWFREFSRSSSLTTASLAAAAGGGLAVVQRLGKAEVGHKTMVDAMAPAASALSDAAKRAESLPAALRRAADAAHAGAASTSQLLAKRGRASYVGENARGVTDPGALTVALFFEAAA
ncbi:dihydroxyacetone kinase subunit DhaL [Amycolatopsis sp. NPDC049253]|uniref:dihydroxyacetone kinase subunit DhaL n=1 Tax=Amycolatopsis sp. NPDC049253 TaxID=3155274 RepID=UPI003429923A